MTTTESSLDILAAVVTTEVPKLDASPAMEK